MVCRITSWTIPALLLAACGGSNDINDAGGIRADGDVIFVTQSVVPNAVMDALFQGRVVRDAAGCLRLDGPDPASVVWPRGFRLERRGNELVVRSDTGREIGRIGGSFRFGGGEIPTLHEGIALTNEDRARALQQCPGRFWIVGTIPAS